jgi:hypothetical protein
MTFAANQQAISHTTVFLVEIDLDFCDRVFGTSPCLATGTKCYNTLPTCKYTTAYLNTAGKTYPFTSQDAPAPFNTGERPYLKSVQFIPTEIKDDLTMPGRVTIEFADELDDDVGVDPYASTRSSVQGTFWKKLIARNPNFKGRAVRIYEGYLGDPESEFQERFRGKIQEFRLGRGTVAIDVADKVVDLTEVEIPPKIDAKLRLAATISQTYFDLDSVSELAAAPNYIRINDEIIQYGTIYTAGNQLTGCTRAQFGTVATAHDEGDKVGRVRYYVADRPTDILGILLATDLGLTGTDYDAVGLVTLWNEPDLKLPVVEGIISEPTKASDLIFELLELGDAYMWVGEDLKIVFARRTPNAGGRVYATLSDADGIIRDSGSANLKDEDRKTRVALYWHKNPVAQDDEDKAEYKRADIAVDQDLEGADWFGEVEEYTIFSRWMREDLEIPYEAHEAKIANWLKRKLSRIKLPRAEIMVDVARKDSDVVTGEFVHLSTDELLDMHGNALSDARYQVMKREDLADRLRLTLRALGGRKLCIIGPGTLPDYTSATANDREYGYISQDVPAEGQMSNGDDGYYIG